MGMSISTVAPDTCGSCGPWKGRGTHRLPHRPVAPHGGRLRVGFSLWWDSLNPPNANAAIHLAAGKCLARRILERLHGSPNR